MSALMWWLIPLGATLAALGWAAWRSRPRRTIDTHASLDDMARFREAMSRPLPDGRPTASRSQASRRPSTRPSARRERPERSAAHGR